jgi:hypothetical protein
MLDGNQEFGIMCPHCYQTLMRYEVISALGLASDSSTRKLYVTMYDGCGIKRKRLRLTMDCPYCGTGGLYWIFDPLDSDLGQIGKFHDISDKLKLNIQGNKNSF